MVVFILGLELCIVQLELLDLFAVDCDLVLHRWEDFTRVLLQILQLLNNARIFLLHHVSQRHRQALHIQSGH